MQPPIKEAVIALLDPDMLLLQPVSARVDSSTVLYSKGSDPTADSRGYSSTAAAVRGTEPWVCEGHPVGQCTLNRAAACAVAYTVLQSHSSCYKRVIVAVVWYDSHSHTAAQLLLTALYYCYTHCCTANLLIMPNATTSTTLTFYGLGGPWANWPDLPDIVQDPLSPALTVTRELAARHYPVGPPYLAHVRDMVQLADKWVEFVPHSVKGHPGLLAEMYAFCIAAAHLQLPHTAVVAIVASRWCSDDVCRELYIVVCLLTVPSDSSNDSAAYTLLTASCQELHGVRRAV
eukprot:16536-Heterococcus_DN1.PRE.4